MSVPLDRLYNFLHDVCNRDDIIIYRFYPHGSRKLSDLSIASETGDSWLSNRHMIFHDQEPLNFDLYNTTLATKEYIENVGDRIIKSKNAGADENILNFYKKLNLRMVLHPPTYSTKPVLLVHSEKNSSNLSQYEDLGMVGVYWWCHAVIAKDWFRYAEHDPALDWRTPTTDFLIYNRAWTGTREYRLKFTELLANNNLLQHTRTKFSAFSDSKHYLDHVYSNYKFQIQRNDLENLLPANETQPTASADYVSNDYQSTELEIVLETLFDDDRIHLTEKVLRPIACGHPFILVSTKGSLDYIRSYGFETFGDYIDESYDSIQDPVDRLEAVVREMKRISMLSAEDKKKLYLSLRSIAERNKKLFFSDKWHNNIVQEFKNNVALAIDVSKKFKVDISDLIGVI